MTNFVNLTPHAINIFDGDTEVLTIAPSGTVARCTQKDELHEEINGVKIFKQVFGEVVDLPEPQENVFFIVSRLVASAAANRTDLLVPGALKRNDQGQPVGCIGLARP